MNPTSISLDRVPPQSIEAEQAVLAALLLDREAIHRALEILERNSFYRVSHRQIFAAILDLYERDEAVDLVTVAEELQRRGDLEAVGGPVYLQTLVSSVATVANVAYHARIVQEKALLRQLIQTAAEVTGSAYDGGESSEEILDRAEQAIFRISEARLKQSFVPVDRVLRDTFERIEMLHERKTHVTGVETGFMDLDVLTAGFQPGDFVVIAGRPSMGKTSFMLNIAQHASIANKVPVAVFSLEMSKEQLVLRLLCSEARVSGHKVRTGFLSEADWPRLTSSAGRLSEAPIYIDDTPTLNVLEMRAKARRLKAEAPLGMIVVDYLQLVRSSQQMENRQQEISHISRSLKALARELDLPVVVGSQLSRAVESRGGEKRPMLSDLRECVAGDTPVLLADGRAVPIRRLVGETPKVLAVSREGRVVTAQSDRVWSVGRRPVFDVRLASGRVVRATARHRLMAAEGWRRISQIAPGDRVAIARELPEPPTSIEWSDERVALLGHLIGDGSYLRGQPLRYTTASEANSELVAGAAAREFHSTVRRYAGRGNWHQLLISGNGNRWHPAGVNAWLRELGIFGQRSYQKRIPEEAFRLKNDQVSLLLRHLWATDSCIHVRKKTSRGANSIYFSTSSEGLARDVDCLLLRLGIVSRINRVVQGAARPWYTVGIWSGPQQREFLDRVGAFGPRVEPAERLLNDARLSRPGNTNVDTLPQSMFRGTSYGGRSHFAFAPSRAMMAEYAEILEDPEMLSLATSDLFWDRVVAIESAGEEEVFDLTVPGPACWLAGGIVSHNSGAIEQDADTVLFIYRSEVYEKTPENEGRAEIIVAKQRNGPIGDISLAFLHEYTRFENMVRRSDV